MKKLTEAIVVETIIDILAKRESGGFNEKNIKTSPTTVCEALEARGFDTMRGGYCRRRPEREAFDFVWDVARDSGFSCSVHGNTRCIRI